MSRYAAYLYSVLSIIVIISTAMCQHNDTAQCNVIWKSIMTHKKCCYFNLLLIWHLPYWQQVKVRILLYKNRHRQESLYNCLTLPVGKLLLVVSVTPLTIYLPVLLERRLCRLLFRFASLQQDTFLLLLQVIDLSSLRFPACCLVTILTELTGLQSAANTLLI